MSKQAVLPRLVPVIGIETSEVTIPTSQKFDDFRVKRWPYILGLPLFLCVGLLAYINRYWNGSKPSRFRSVLFNGRSDVIGAIQENGGNAVALHLLYRLRRMRQLLPSPVERYWTNVPMIQGAQNRAVVVRRVISEIILSSPRPLRILSLAAGLAEPLLWAVHDCEENGHGSAEVLLTDLKRRSLDQARSIAEETLRMRTPVRVERLNLAKLAEVRGAVRKFRPDLVEIIGFIDYVDDTTAVELLKGIRNECGAGTKIITGNILPVSWIQRFLAEEAYGWPSMHYRALHRLEDLVRAAGYDVEQSLEEPNRIFAVLVAG